MPLKSYEGREATEPPEDVASSLGTVAPALRGDFEESRRLLGGAWWEA